MSKPNSFFEYSTPWFNYALDNPGKVKSIHHALYFYIVEHSNRIVCQDKISIPFFIAMGTTGIRSYTLYTRAMNDLVDFGFISLIEKGNQIHRPDVIALTNLEKSIQS